ncbi:MAG: hypothetical protein IJE09_01170 [Oscillospiraceae bacterium]|nr:hypothetical protein [Oscillospiraceae bacterium]
MKKVAVIHSGMGTVEQIKKLFAELLPEVKLINIVDDSLAGSVLQAGYASPAVVKAVGLYALAAQGQGCDALYNPCALIRGAADAAQEMLDIPYLCNDVPMTREAIKIGKRIGLVTANQPAMNHVSKMVEREIAAAGQGNVLNKYVCLEAFHALTKEKNKEKYNALMTEAVSRAAKENDVVLLGQGSMFAADYPGMEVPVLDVHESGVLGLKELIK